MKKQLEIAEVTWEDVVGSLDLGRKQLSESLEHDEDLNPIGDSIIMAQKLSNFVLQDKEFKTRVDAYISIHNNVRSRTIRVSEASDDRLFATVFNLPSLEFLTTPAGYLWFMEEFITIKEI